MAATLESSAATAVTVTMVVTVATLVGTAAAAVTVALQVRTSAVTVMAATVVEQDASAPAAMAVTAALAAMGVMVARADCSWAMVVTEVTAVTAVSELPQCHLSRAPAETRPLTAVMVATVV